VSGEILLLKACQAGNTFGKSQRENIIPFLKKFSPLIIGEYQNS